jgi:hypothetical protein
VRKAECDKRGPLCRGRESEEQARRLELATAIANQELTDRAAQLDSELTRVRDQLAKAEPVQAVNPQGAALARLFHLPEADAATAATWQQFAVAVIVELLIVGSFIAHELLGRDAPAAKGEPVVDPERVVTALPVQRAPESAIIVPPKRQRPKLVSSSLAASSGSVPELLADLLEPANGGRVEIEDAYRAYAGRCKAMGKRSAAPEQFIEPLQAFCREFRIESEQGRGRVYLLGVRLMQSDDIASADRASVH